MPDEQQQQQRMAKLLKAMYIMESSDLKCGSKSIISYLVTYFGPDQLSSAFFAKVSETLPDIKKNGSEKRINENSKYTQCSPGMFLYYKKSQFHSD